MSNRYLAGKTYYFGVGGGMRQFENLVEKDSTFDIKNIWKSEDGKFENKN